MNAIKYSNGDFVNLGDHVKIINEKLFSRKTSYGIVSYIPNIDKPLSRELNDFGINIKIINSKNELWIDTEILPENIILINRTKI